MIHVVDDLANSNVVLSEIVQSYELVTILALQALVVIVLRVRFFDIIESLSLATGRMKFLDRWVSCETHIPRLVHLERLTLVILIEVFVAFGRELCLFVLNIGWSDCGHVMSRVES